MECKGRLSLAAVKQFLQYGTFPKDCKKAERRAVRKRSQTFVFRDNQLYYTGGRPKRSNDNEDEEEASEILENTSAPTQILRKCCVTEEEKHEAVMQNHIGDDGNHFGIEKTTERVSSTYYWVGIVSTVRKVLHSCDFCVARGIRLSSGILTNPMVTVNSAQENGNIKTETDPAEEPDVFFMSRETCTRFWQKVEVQVFGPYMAGKRLVYVAVALDCYSQFPEAMIIENISAATLTTFVLNLICRYGVMEKLCMMQNKCTKDVYLYINMQDLEIADISPTFLSQNANPADERWKRVSKNLDGFVKKYPRTWDRCLEAFMVPLRISLPPQADYAPSYLTFNRDPVLPEKLSHKSSTSGNTELRLTEEDEKQTIDLLMSAYGKHARPSSNQQCDIDLDLSLLPTVKLEPLPSFPDGDVLHLDGSSFVPLNFDGEEGPQRRSQRAAVRKLEETGQTMYDGISDDDGDDGFSDYEEDRDETYQPGVTSNNLAMMGTRSSSRKRTPTFKAIEGLLPVKKEKHRASPPPKPTPEPEQPVKRKRGRPPKIRPDVNIASEAVEALGDQLSKPGGRGSAAAALTNNGLMNSVEQLDLDLYYLIIKCYKERGVYPPRVSVDFKRAVRRLAETVEIKDGKMYGCVGKAAGRLIIVKERERFSLMMKVHVKGEEHVGRVRMLKTLLDINVFWRGMSLDLDAFIHACPECVARNPMRNKTVVRVPSISKVVTTKDHDGDPHMSEDEEEESSYEDLIQYLIDGTFPASTTPHQQSCIQLRAKTFCIINGSLHYKSPAHPKSQPRLVLFSEKTRQAAIHEVHVEGENHISVHDTQAILRRQYFWSGMTYDVMRYIMACCMMEPLKAEPAEHRSSVIQQRVDKFREYYRAGIPDMIGEMDITGALTGDLTANDSTAEAMEQDVTVEEDVGTTEDNGESESASSDPRVARENLVLRKAMEAVIVKVGGEWTEDSAKERKSKLLAKPQGPLTANQLRVQRGKTKHKCDHCYRIIKGDVAFKVHLYKHTGIKPFSCNVCGKSFSNRKSQRIHMRKHTGVRPYLCNQCGREFFRSASLRYHLKVHATGGGTSVSCDVCGRSFSTEHRLLRHKEFKHPAHPKVYMCNQCGKYFTAARSLKRHEQTHSGVRKYQCQFCTKAFFRKEYLNAHITNHPEYDPEAEKLKPRKKPGKKPKSFQPEGMNAATVVVPGTSGDSVPSNVVHWTDTERPVHQLEERMAVSNLERLQQPTMTTLHPPHVSSQSLTHAPMAHMPTSSIVSRPHTLHPSLHHPIPHTTRLMNVPGSHGPLSLTVSAGRPQIEVLHGRNGQEILLQHDNVPVQYEVECLSGEPPSLTEADLNAIHMLAQASMTGQNMHSM